MRRLRVRSSQPDLRGSRESLLGPTTWVRPATGWWGRMNAGRKTLRNQGRTVWAPLSVSRRRSRGLRKTPQWGAERRATAAFSLDLETAFWRRTGAPIRYALDSAEFFALRSSAPTSPLPDGPM